MEKRKRWDKSRPDTKCVVDQIVHGNFVKEGTMIAFPTCFPGVTVPIPADESHITALSVADSGMIYGGTSGRRSHLFVAMFHGVTGLVLDLGIVEGADSCQAVGLGRKEFVACVNGPLGGRLVAGKYQPLPFDLIQEWGFTRPPLEVLGEPVKGEKILHAVVDSTGTRVIGASEKHLFSVDLDSRTIEVVAELSAQGHLALSSSGIVVGAQNGSLWCYDPRIDRLEARWQSLPAGRWDGSSPIWAQDPSTEALYVVDSEGTILSFDEREGFSEQLGKTPLAPVDSMAATLDGRLFMACGEGISKFFCYDPSDRSIRDIGVAVSVIERRRYGYRFGAAAMGRDGQLIFGEDDDLGHLWLYFPRVMRIARTTARS